MRTYAGRWFKCKSCGRNHLIPFETINDNSKQDINIRIECPVTHEQQIYTRESFKYWHGFYSVYVCEVVKPISVETIRKK